MMIVWVKSPKGPIFPVNMRRVERLKERGYEVVNPPGTVKKKPSSQEKKESGKKPSSQEKKESGKKPSSQEKKESGKKS